jgi:hypothetical protein
MAAPAIGPQRVAIENEAGVLVSVDDRLALNIARAMEYESFNPPRGEPAERPFPIS